MAFRLWHGRAGGIALHFSLVLFTVLLASLLSARPALAQSPGCTEINTGRMAQTWSNSNKVLFAGGESWSLEAGERYVLVFERDPGITFSYIRLRAFPPGTSNLHQQIAQIDSPGEYEILELILEPGINSLAWNTFGYAGTGTASVTLSCTTQPPPITDPVSDAITDYYQTILSRSPDAGGLAYWTNEALRLRDLSVDVNEAFRVMAGQFFNSPEYLGRNTSNTQFVTDLYRTFFRREPETGGRDFWTDELGAGVPRDIVMFNFLFSNEFANYTSALFGTTVTRPEVSLIVDFYRGLLGRLPDSDGFNYWLARFRTAQCAGSSAVTAEVDAISRLFANLPEYAARGRNNAQYIADLYYGFLRRGGDRGGFDAWNNALTTESMSREDVRWQFMLSPEFQARVNLAVDAGCLP